MKATIDERGVLRVEPESPLEAFALRSWWEKAQHWTEKSASGPGSVLGIKSERFIVALESPKENS